MILTVCLVTIRQGLCHDLLHRAVLHLVIFPCCWSFWTDLSNSIICSRAMSLLDFECVLNELGVVAVSKLPWISSNTSSSSSAIKNEPWSASTTGCSEISNWSKIARISLSIDLKRCFNFLFSDWRSSIREAAQLNNTESSGSTWHALRRSIWIKVESRAAERR